MYVAAEKPYTPEELMNTPYRGPGRVFPARHGALRRLLLRYRDHDRVAFALLELWKYRPSQLLKCYRLAIGYGASRRRFAYEFSRAALTLPFSWRAFDFDRAMRFLPDGY